MTTSPPLRRLAGHDVQIVAVRETLDRVAPGAFDRLSISERILAENLVRHGRGAELDAQLRQLIDGRGDQDFPFFPARVVLQDLLGTPALVDLAGLRHAIADRGGDPLRVNPVVPTQLVVDHSLNVDAGGMEPDALARNMAIEQRRNVERFEFLAWARTAFRNLDIVMPGNGILHQINLERMTPVVRVKDGIAFADTLVGTDSHTTMINAAGVLGWGVGGIEAESVMLGRPIWMRPPAIVSVEITGTRRAGVQATDLVLALTEYMRRHDVVDSILEFHGAGIDRLALADRATIANMAPEFGATAALFPIDTRTLDFLAMTGRRTAQIELVEAYARAQGLWADTLDPAAGRHRQLSFDLGTVGRAIAGPADPHQRIPLDRLVGSGVAREGTDDTPPTQLPDGAIVIAAITSCTNTANPRNMIAAGLLAQRAVALGLQRKPWVKTSFAPGSKVVEAYLDEAGLLAPLGQLGFAIVGYGCTSCNGMSGGLPAAIEAEILARDLAASAVLSGNRNFKGRIHPRVRNAFLASPALVVAYAIAGTTRIDLMTAPLGFDGAGDPVHLDDLWPSDAQIDAVLAAHVRGAQFDRVYDAMFADEPAAAGTGPASPLFDWREDSNYIRRPPYWHAALTADPIASGLRAIAMLGDNVTTDDLSPSGAILPDSMAGRYLVERGVAPSGFNSYGTRRGDHLVAMRATFANPRLVNEIVPGVEGAFTRLFPEAQVMPIFEAAQAYRARGQQLIVIAGRNYGCGSSRDWAAKGVRLLGVRAVVCESFERIHRTNLVGMGVLPLEFADGITRHSLDLDGSETFTIAGLDRPLVPGMALSLEIARADGHKLATPVRCRIDTTEECRVFLAGGLLPRIADEIAAGQQAATEATTQGM